MTMVQQISFWINEPRNEAIVILTKMALAIGILASCIWAEVQLFSFLIG